MVIIHIKSSIERRLSGIKKEFMDVTYYEILCRKLLNKYISTIMLTEWLSTDGIK